MVNNYMKLLMLLPWGFPFVNSHRRTSHAIGYTGMHGQQQRLECFRPWFGFVFLLVYAVQAGGPVCRRLQVCSTGVHDVQAEEGGSSKYISVWGWVGGKTGSNSGLVGMS